MESDGIKFKPRDAKILAIGQNVFGFGDTIDEAVKVMKKVGRTSYYRVYVCHPDTKMYDDGSWSAPTHEWFPKLIHTVGLDKDGKPKKRSRR